MLAVSNLHTSTDLAMFFCGVSSSDLYSEGIYVTLLASNHKEINL